MADTIISLEEVRALNQTPDADTTKDILIEMLIPVVEDFIKTYCNDDFDGDFPEGLKLAAVKIIQYELQKLSPGISSESIGNYSVNYSGEYPKEITSMLNHFRKVKFL